jgi:hypothetical protein
MNSDKIEVGASIHQIHSPFGNKHQKGKLLLVILVVLLLTFIVFLFIINGDPRAKVLLRIWNGRRRIKGSHLMDRRVWKVKDSGHSLLIFLMPMKLLSQPSTIGLMLPSIFADHVEASKQAFCKKVEFSSLTPVGAEYGPDTNQ